MSASAAPKAATIVAPVGRSHRYDANRPATLTTAPTVQPMASRDATPLASKAATAAGTTRNEKTSSTPARRTELVTTTANDT